MCWWAVLRSNNKTIGPIPCFDQAGSDPGQIMLVTPFDFASGLLTSCHVFLWLNLLNSLMLVIIDGLWWSLMQEQNISPSGWSLKNARNTPEWLYFQSHLWPTLFDNLHIPPCILMLSALDQIQKAGILHYAISNFLRRLDQTSYASLCWRRVFPVNNSLHPHQEGETWTKQAIRERKEDRVNELRGALFAPPIRWLSHAKRTKRSRHDATFSTGPLRVKDSV